MTPTLRAFATLDLGAATTATALIARIEGRWRLLGALSGPATAPADRLLDLLAGRIRALDPDLAEAAGLPVDAAGGLPRVIARSRPPETIAVLAVSERGLSALVSVVARTGWRWVAASAELHDQRAMTALLLDPSISAVIAGAAEPPGGDERNGVPELAALVAAAAGRRPGLTIVLAGSLGALRGMVAAVGGMPVEAIHVGPAADGGKRAQAGLTGILADLRRDDADSRQAIGRSAPGLAGALDRRVEVLEVGLDGGVRASGIPGATAGDGAGRWVTSSEGALVPPELDESALEAVLDWSTIAVDRHRLRDRLLELRATPWSGVAGDGARLRLAAARAAMARLVDATPEFDEGPAPDLLVIAGGAFAVAPAAATLLAVADVVRRPGAVHVAVDHARLLGPLGTIEDAVERDCLIADLAGDLLVPLGAVVMPAGLPAGRRAGRLVVDGPAGRSEMGLDSGLLESVDLPTASHARVTLESGQPILLASRGRHVSIEVAGGIAGLLVDLRDIPLRLPDRLEARRELLARWQAAAWPGADE